MRITNNMNLPEAVYNVLARDNYVKGESDYSVTGLLKSPRQLQLEQRFTDDLVEDASDRVWSLLGSAAHNVLEQHASIETIAEERLMIKICDRILSGQVDNYHGGVITDYKVTSTYTVINNSKVDDWTFQLNTYAKIFRDNNYEVKELQIVVILRDWSRMRAKLSKDYPQCPIQIIPIALLSDEEITNSITDKLTRHIEAETLPTNQLPLCSEEDMWQTPTVYAVMKKGRKSAIKLYESYDAAVERVEEEGSAYYLETRLGERRKCKDYCACAGVCSQYQEYINDGIQ